jgi:uncharacterized membrane protein YphA (DoxX/SURF4 family)
MTSGKPPAATGLMVAIVRILLGGLFIFAGAMKLSDLQGFAFSVKAFEIFPAHAEHAVRLVTFAVPWTELIIGVMLVLGYWTRGAALLLAGILLGFVAGIVSVLARDMNVTCGCFGRFERPCTGPIGVCHVIRNGVLLLSTLFVVWKGPGSMAIDRQVER